MTDGWIKLHRKLLENPIFNNPDLLKVWIWCLLKASHKGHKQMVGLQEVKLKEGQFVTGRFAASNELKINPSTFYKYLKTLAKLQMIVLNSNNKMTIVTIENWAKHQVDDSESYQQNNNKITTKEQQSNTNKNGKKDKKLYIDHFETFWSTYPKKVGKAAAQKSFQRLKVNNELLEAMLSSIEIQKQSKQWSDKQFIPNPATYLNQRRWEDEFETELSKEQIKITSDGAFQF